MKYVVIWHHLLVEKEVTSPSYSEQITLSDEPTGFVYPCTKTKSHTASECTVFTQTQDEWCV
jgi:hypothetical protein